MNSRIFNPDLVVAVLVVLFAALVLSTAYSYSGISGTFPQLVGWIFLGLSLLELTVQVKALVSSARPAGDHIESNEKLGVLKEIKAFLWLGVLLFALYLVGFMISTPLYVFAFLRLSGNRSLVMSASVAAGATAFVHVVFVQLLEYKLYPGILLMG